MILVYQILFLLTITFFTSNSNELEIGKNMPKMMIKMKNIDDSMISLSDMVKENGLLVIFSCNTCPYVLSWQNRYNELNRVSKKNKIGMILINSNEAYRDGDDSLEKMKIHATKNNYSMPYVVDKNHEIADAFGANRTPHVFLFNSNKKLVYRGAIDDNKKIDEVTKTYLIDALNLVGNNQEVTQNTTKSIGCTIKRISK